MLWLAERITNNWQGIIFFATLLVLADQILEVHRRPVPFPDRPRLPGADPDFVLRA